jgi:hypothetical protein
MKRKFTANYPCLSKLLFYYAGETNSGILCKEYINLRRYEETEDSSIQKILIIVRFLFFPLSKFLLNIVEFCVVH